MPNDTPTRKDTHVAMQQDQTSGGREQATVLKGMRGMRGMREKEKERERGMERMQPEQARAVRLPH